MKRPLLAWIAGAVVTALLLTFAYPMRIRAPIPKVALERLGFVPIWEAEFEWTSPGWVLGEILVGMAITVLATKLLPNRNKT